MVTRVICYDLNAWLILSVLLLSGTPIHFRDLLLSRILIHAIYMLLSFPMVYLTSMLLTLNLARVSDSNLIGIGYFDSFYYTVTVPCIDYHGEHVTVYNNG